MADLVGLDEEFFTEESYREYLKQQSPIQNDRIRGKDETIFDALMSEEADFTKTPYGDEIVSTLRDYK